MKKIITFEEAVSLLPNEENIHTFRQAPFGLMGCDWSKDEIFELLKNPETTIELTGESARGMKHGMCAYRKDAKYQSDIVFIETDEEKLSAFEQAYSSEV